MNFAIWNKGQVRIQKIIPKGSKNNKSEKWVWVKVYSVQQSSKPRIPSACAKSKGRREATRWKWNQGLSARWKVAWHPAGKKERPWNIVQCLSSIGHWAHNIGVVYEQFYFFLILLSYFLNSAPYITICLYLGLKSFLAFKSSLNFPSNFTFTLFTPDINLFFR